jgi:hypothetical protein
VAENPCSLVGQLACESYMQGSCQLIGLIHDIGKLQFLWGGKEDGQEGTADGDQVYHYSSRTLSTPRPHDLTGVRADAGTHSGHWVATPGLSDASSQTPRCFPSEYHLC